MRKSPLVVLLAGLVLLVVGPLVTVESVADHRAQSRALQNDAVQIAAGFTAHFERVRSLNLMLGQHPALHQFPDGEVDPAANAEANAALQHLVDLYRGEIGQASLVDDSGRELARVSEDGPSSMRTLADDKTKSSFFEPTLALEPGEVYQSAPYLSAKTGSWVVSSSAPVQVDDGGRVIVHVEVSLSSFAERLSTEDADRYAAVVDLAEGRTIIDGGGRLPYWNSDFPTFEHADAVGSVGDTAQTVDTGGGHGLAVAPIAAGAGNANHWAIVQWSDTEPGLLPAWVGLAGTALAGILVVLYVFLVRRQHLVLRKAARRDHLTGMGNRQALEEALEAAVRASEQGEGTGVLVMDLDGFKQINDTLGHDEGDRVLKVIADRLHANTFGHDTAARLGGDEFAVVLRKLHGPDDVLAVAHRLRDALVRPIELDGVPRFVGVSIGAALCPDHGTAVSELLRAADAAMYGAKRGREGIRIYEPGTAGGAERSGLAAELLLAIETDRIKLVFQPERSLDTGSIVTAEALARWERSDGTHVPPSEFIPLAEETGLIRPLTLLTLRKALDEVVAWRAAGSDVRVSVNLSGRLVVDRSLPGLVQELLDERGLEGDHLVLEITETVAIASMDAAREVLRELRGSGIRIELDDFGSGYASARTLRDVPLDGIKIDRELVNDATSGGRHMLATTIDMSKALNLYVVAEGIEDEAALDAMRSLGADVAQGYHLARPMQPAAMRALLAGESDVAPEAGTPAGALDPGLLVDATAGSNQGRPVD
jgi:diguanylate cyclase (GGDEF)-like protein